MKRKLTAEQREARKTRRIKRQAAALKAKRSTKKVRKKTKTATRNADKAFERRLKITLQHLALAAAPRRLGDDKRVKPEQTFRLPDFPPGVAPESGQGLAMDELPNLGAQLAWAAESTFGEGLQFLGYAFLSELAQRPEYRMVSERIATEMTRKWIKFQSTDKEDKKEDRINELIEAFDHFKVKDRFRENAEQDGFFGRSHLRIHLKNDDKGDEAQTSIGDGIGPLTKLKIKKGYLERLTVIEPLWCYPMNYNSNDPSSPEWYNPTKWIVMGKTVHASRLLRFVGREVPDILKPAYAFGGLSLSQMIKPYVDKWLRNVNSVSDLIDMFSKDILKTDLQQLLSGASEDLLNRIELLNLLRANRGTLLLDKNSEEYENVATPLGTLDVLQAQSLEHIAAIAHLPLIIFLGIQPAGLNASSEGEIRAFYDWILAFQEKFFRHNLTKVMHFIMLHLWGEIDTKISFIFEPLWSMDDAQKSTKRKADADTDVAYVDAGILSEEEVRTRLANDPDTPYQGIDPSAVPEPPEPEESLEDGNVDGEADREEEEPTDENDAGSSPSSERDAA